MLVDYWRSDVNRNKEGETGTSECEVTKTRYLEAEELREIWDLSWKSSFQNNLVPVVCIILTSVLRRFLLTSLTFFFFFSGAQFRFTHLSLIADSSTLCPAIQPIPLLLLLLLLLFCSLRQALQATYKMI